MILDALLGRRMKPSLVIIGAQKAGTTTLFDILAQHPQVIAPKKKEISFFSNDEQYAMGIERYWEEFPRHPRAFGRYITLDASPMYLYHEQAPERIAKHLPDALCLAILRDPVDRAYSAWNMYRSFKDHPVHGHLYDPRSFEEAVEEELKGVPVMPAKRYLHRGEYAPQLSRYVEAIGSKRLVVWEFEDLVRRPHQSVSDICDRLGVGRMSKDAPAFRTRSNARSYESTMPQELKVRLSRYFDEDRIKTAALNERYDLTPEALR